MGINLIAILLSLAMMLTGAGQEGQDAAVSRSLVLHNINVSYNGETIRLGHQARLGASTDGSRAVFDFGVDLDGERLLPIQLGADETGVTARFAGTGDAVTVTAGALEGLAAMLEEQMQGAVSGVDEQSGALVDFIMNEFMPAYTGVLNAAMDAETREAIQAKCDKAYESFVDRGEGEPAAVEIDGMGYDVTRYAYALDGAQIAALSDAIYQADPVIEAYYNALFKLYAMLPEESGLNGIDSFEALFGRFGLDMRLDIEEQRSDDGEIDIMDIVLTLDLSAMLPTGDAAEQPGESVEQAAAEEGEYVAGEPEGDAEDDGDEEADETEADDGDDVGLEPLVMIIHGQKVGAVQESSVTCAYDIDAHHSIDLSMESMQEAQTQDVEMTMTQLEDGVGVRRSRLSMFTVQDEGQNSYSLSLRDIAQDTSAVDAGVYGVSAPDGTSENSFAFAMRTEDANIGVSFDLDVTADAIEDAVNGAEGAHVIDDLSAQGIQALMEDAELGGLLARVGAGLAADAGKLTQDAQAQKLAALIREGRLPIDINDIEDEVEMYEDDDEFSYVIDGDAMEDDALFDYEQAEDDGVLGFEVPEFTWLPQGWTVAAGEPDTAYDWVEMSMMDEAGNECAYVVFFADTEEEAASYIVQENGSMVEGREISVTDFGEGGMSVTVREGGLYGTLMFTSEAIDIETLGKIVAGIDFGGQ